MNLAKPTIITIAAALLAMSAATTATAQPRTYWSLNGSGGWEVNGNWTAGEPVTGYAIINNAGTANIRLAGEICDWLYLPGSEEPGGSGFAAIHAGADLTAQAMLVGYWGTGAFLHNHGDVSLLQQGLYMGRWGGVGLYDMYDGTLHAGVEDIGLSEGSANFYQHGGTNTVDNVIYVGGGGWGTYYLTGGDLTTPSLWVANGSNGLFTQDDGTVTVLTALSIGADGGVGTYELNGGDLTAPQASIGVVTLGNRFEQNGGDFIVSGALTLGSNASGGGTYDLNQGLLIADVIDIGMVGTGAFNYLNGNPSLDMINVGANGVMDVIPPWTCRHPLNIMGGRVDLHREVSIESLTSGADVHMTSGQLNSSSLWVGYAGGTTGTVTQDNGTHTVSAELQLGRSAGSIGAYELNDGQVDVTLSTYVGNAGEGSFVQRHGTHAITQSLYLGFTASGQGTYELEGGGLTANAKYIGYDGQGTFTQTGGFSDPTLYVAYGPDSYGEYLLYGGDVMADAEYIGYGGDGFFIHMDGFNTVDGPVYLGYEPDAIGVYDLGNVGHLFAQFETLGYHGLGHVHQWGGTSNIVTHDLVLGRYPTGEGDYLLEEGELFVEQDEVIGYEGVGRFMQMGPAYHHVERDLYIGRSAGGQGEFILLMGALDAGNLYIGYDGWGRMEIGGSDISVVVFDTLRFGGRSVFVAGEGTLIRMLGSAFENVSTGDDDLVGLNNLTLRFEGGTQTIDPMEVGGRDYGKKYAGFVENFALEGLVIGNGDVGQVQLVDQFDNQPTWTGNDAQYTETFEITAGSYLDLNGLKLYYRYGTIDPNATIVYNGGELIQVCVGDVDESGAVTFEDLLELLSAWGPCDDCWEDRDADGQVGFSDLLIILGAWGTCP